MFVCVCVCDVCRRRDIKSLNELNNNNVYLILFAVVIVVVIFVVRLFFSLFLVVEICYGECVCACTK